MAKKLYAVMGATGHIGHVLTQELLKRGHNVRALGRNEHKLKALKSQGAETFLLDEFDRLPILTEAFKGADAVFSFTPPGYAVENVGLFQDSVGESIKTALQKNNVSYVVNLSSIGAHLAERTGPIKGLYRQELRLNTLSNTHLLHLRPSYFMENILWLIPSLHETGILGSPIRADLSIPMIASKDIALKAAEFLSHLEFKGQSVFEFLGPREVTFTEVAKILGKAINLPNLNYMQIPYQDSEKYMVASGMKRPTAALMIEMYKAFNDGLCQTTQKITPDHYGATPIEEFAQTFAQAYTHKARPIST